MGKSVISFDAHAHARRKTRTSVFCSSMKRSNGRRVFIGAVIRAVETASRESTVPLAIHAQFGAQHKMPLNIFAELIFAAAILIHGGREGRALCGSCSRPDLLGPFF